MKSCRSQEDLPHLCGPALLHRPLLYAVLQPPYTRCNHMELQTSALFIDPTNHPKDMNAWHTSRHRVASWAYVGSCGGYLTISK